MMRCNDAVTFHSDPAAARGGSVGSDSPSWISMAKQKQKIYQEKSLDMTVKKVSDFTDGPTPSLSKKKNLKLYTDFIYEKKK